MSTVEFRNIVKKYGALTVLENLSLTVADGEFLVLLGPSGCGKTTLLNILAGLMEIDAGAVIIDGEDVTERDPKDRGLAMVFQSYALYPTKTVTGNLRFGLSARKLSREEIERRIAWAAKLLQIDHLLDRKPSQLSGGQRQRVAIGRALVKQVGLFLFDEPLSNLDAKLRTEMRLEIKKLHNRLKNTVVYVTHDQVEAMTMATKIAVMNKGVIQQVGTPDEIYDHPENVFVADFLGSPAMNMLDGEVAASPGAGGVQVRVHREAARSIFPTITGGWPRAKARRCGSASGPSISFSPARCCRSGASASICLWRSSRNPGRTRSPSSPWMRRRSRRASISGRRKNSAASRSPHSASRSSACTSSTPPPAEGCEARAGARR